MKILWDDREIRLTVVVIMDNSIQIPLDLPDVRIREVTKTEEGAPMNLYKHRQSVRTEVAP